ncbi:MAG TPA: hypothetical protein VL053_17760 [Arachidicoccus sp.]|nr:hypothetical protein [Arachidicoccus sp.]
MFALLIITRILFIACIVFIIGYIFGGFSKKPVLRTMSRIAAILIIILFISMNVFVGRSGGWHNGWCGPGYSHGGNWNNHGHLRANQDTTNFKNTN